MITVDEREEGPTLDLETLGVTATDQALIDLADAVHGIYVAVEGIHQVLDRLGVALDRQAAAISSLSAIEHERAAAEHERAARQDRIEDQQQRLTSRSVSLAAQTLTSPLWWAAVGPLIGWLASGLIPPADVAEAVGAPPPPSAGAPLIAPGTPEDE